MNGTMTVHELEEDNARARLGQKIRENIGFTHAETCKTCAHARQYKLSHGDRAIRCKWVEDRFDSPAFEIGGTTRCVQYEKSPVFSNMIPVFINEPRERQPLMTGVNAEGEEVIYVFADDKRGGDTGDIRKMLEGLHFSSDFIPFNN